MDQRLSFSQRMGLAEVRTALQVEQIDQRLRNHLWNTICEHFIHPDEYPTRNWDSQNGEVLWRYKTLHTMFFGDTWLEAPHDPYDYYLYFKKWYDDAKWNAVYDLIEFLSAELLQDSFTTAVNSCLESELAGYRVIGQRVVPVTTPTEVASVEASLAAADGGVGRHFAEALEMLSRRSASDYRNVVKESISGVEAACRLVVSKDSATLGDALKFLERDSKVHAALAAAFQKLYGWTSDADGIRHSLTADSTPVDANTARFMLIACSAFANLLLAKR